MAQGIRRYERILDLFDAHEPEWTVQGMSDALNTSSSTLYRLIRELVDVGMLESTVESRYRLGPLFIEYYRRIRLNDPLVRSGGIFLKPLMQQIPVPAVVVLARLYNGQVMCVADERSPGAQFQTSYELGRPMPILRGATSKAVLSTMPPKVAQRFLEKKITATSAEIAVLGMELATIRRTGFSETSGEVDQGLVGIAAPVRNTRLGINASVSVVIERSSLDKEIRLMILSALAGAAKMIENFMRDTTENEAAEAN
ncbi:MAG: IclR family transcriptional regulator C-terminal domain-containing protein [Pseudomonadota bacterium]